MYITRIAKIVMVACLAIFCLLVVFGNLTDYQSNFLFVKHVMSMDTTYPGNKMMYRAVTSPELWHTAYALIIFGEAVAGVLLLGGAVRLLQVRREPGAVFGRAKGLTVMGLLVAFVVWFFGFMVTAGEWFAMWQSQTWNGQEAAFYFYVTALAILIFVVLSDKDLEDASPVKAEAQTTGKTPSKRSHAPAKKKATAKKWKQAETSEAASRRAEETEKIQEES